MLHTAVAGFSFLLCTTARTPKHCISDFVSIQWFSDFKHLVFIQLFMQVAVFFSYYSSIMWFIVVQWKGKVAPGRSYNTFKDLILCSQHIVRCDITEMCVLLGSCLELDTCWAEDWKCNQFSLIIFYFQCDLAEVLIQWSYYFSSSSEEGNTNWRNYYCHNLTSSNLSATLS